MSPDLLERMAEVFQQSCIEVLYGPTEGTMICASYEFKPGERAQGQMIGRPLGNVQLRIRSERGEDVPIGARGEIWIGGAGVTRGYRGQEQLTKEKYVKKDRRGTTGRETWRGMGKTGTWNIWDG